MTPSRRQKYPGKERVRHGLGVYFNWIPDGFPADHRLEVVEKEKVQKVSIETAKTIEDPKRCISIDIWSGLGIGCKGSACGKWPSVSPSGPFLAYAQGLLSSRCSIRSVRGEGGSNHEDEAMKGSLRAVYARRAFHL